MDNDLHTSIDDLLDPADENNLWRAAYLIADVGASNPKGVAYTLLDFSKRFDSKHTAIRAISDHLLYLYGYGLGPESEVFDILRMHGRRLGLL